MHANFSLYPLLSFCYRRHMNIYHSKMQSLSFLLRENMRMIDPQDCELAAETVDQKQFNQIAFLTTRLDQYTESIEIRILMEDGLRGLNKLKILVMFLYIYIYIAVVETSIWEVVIEFGNIEIQRVGKNEKGSGKLEDTSTVQA